MRGLKDKVAIVTGGIGDLGLASAIRLQEEGCKVAIFDVKEKSDAVGDIAYYKTDITNEANIQESVAAVHKDLGLPQILINSAAIFIFKGVDATVEEWQKILNVNVIGMSLVTKYVVPLMKEAGGGSIVSFSSISGFIAQKNFATYSTSKAAIRGMVKCWAQDLAPSKIRVNSICPGYIYTTAFENSCKLLNLDLEEEDKRAAALHLLNRQGRPEEIGAAVAFLASEDSSFMTGSDLIVDGGYMAT